MCQFYTVRGGGGETGNMQGRLYNETHGPAGHYHAICATGIFAQRSAPNELFS